MADKSDAKLHWAKIGWASLGLSLLLHLMIVTGWLGDLVGHGEGFAGGYAILAALFVLYPLIVFASAVVVTCWAKERRVWHFFATMFVSLVINLVFISGLMSYNRYQVQQAVQASYEVNPQSRTLDDPKRPLSLIDVKLLRNNSGLAAQLVVHALPQALAGSTMIVEVKPDPYPDSTPWGQAELINTGKQSEGGRMIFNAEVAFTPPQDWQEGIIFVIGNEQLIDNRRIYPNQIIAEHH